MENGNAGKIIKETFHTEKKKNIDINFSLKYSTFLFAVKMFIDLSLNVWAFSEIAEKLQSLLVVHAIETLLIQKLLTLREDSSIKVSTVSFRL